MAFDQSTRNRLARFVSDARALLTEEYTRQLQHEYGLDPLSGEVTEIEKLTALDDVRRETARILRETMDYYLGGVQANAKSRHDVLDRIVREQAFTVLNRLCTLRMAEARGLALESIAQVYQSNGFQLYARLAGSSLGETGDAYRCYLFSLFDEFAVDLPVLFDRFSPQGRLFPREAALLKLLELINDPEIETLWSEDETIGWIYQYFNSKEERQAMRAASQAPRNSRELAVRNQFFTPRYVVEFLTDNTLGRIWYEMTKGETRIKETCRYLIRRPNEIFLNEGEEITQQEQANEDLTQEELLKQPAYISHRPLKDPREIKMLDPACGSMHFGLYAFDLFEQIYAEAWELEATLSQDALWRMSDLDALHATYPDKEAFLQDVPRLIIECNIHGIDIDPRAVQIAGLSLWLRAQKSWKVQGVKPHERPQIRKSNIVCAEPMPGNLEMLEEFLSTLREDHLEELIRKALRLPAEQKIRPTKAITEALAKLVRTVWMEMELAGEAGSLLKIEITLREAIAAARKVSEEKAPLFRVLEFGINQPANEQFIQELAGEEHDFWNRAELLVLGALHEYAEHAENGSGFQRRLFAEDAVQGFAFIDLCRRRYDFIVMNPPFGESSVSTRDYMNYSYPDSKTDIGMAFVNRFILLLDHGRLGAITNRVFIANDSLEEWRKEYILGGKSLVEILLDLGFGVLDDALVETACYIVSNQKSILNQTYIIRVLDERDKTGALKDFFFNGVKRTRTFIFLRKLSDFINIPGRVFAYQIPLTLINRITKGESIELTGGKAVQGLIPSDDYRFLRLAWEVPYDEIGKNNKWVFYAKGGEYNPYWDDIHLLVKWMNKGEEISNFYSNEGKLRSRPQNIGYYFKPGITYPERTTSDFSPRVLPANCIFSAKGQGIFCSNPEKNITYITGSYSRPFKLIIDSMCGSGDDSVPGSAASDYRSGLISRLPAPLTDKTDTAVFISNRIIKLVFITFLHDETTRYFAPYLFSGKSLTGSVECLNKANIKTNLLLLEMHKEIENLVYKELGFSDEDKIIVDLLVGSHPLSYPSLLTKLDTNLLKQLCHYSESELMRYAVEQHGARRQLTKKAYYANRRLEIYSHILQKNANSIGEEIIQSSLFTKDEDQNIITYVLSYALGCAFGRWDICYTTGEKTTPEIFDLFSPLPVCPPGLLQNSQGQPAIPKDVQLEYPLRISWPGILVEDEGHSDDIEQRVREVLIVIWQERAEAIEQETCQLLGVRSLREYFQKPGGFFADHLKRYSKSRRQAPIYWPLSTPSCSYTLWLYYHRLSDQILFTCVNDFIDPKLKQVSEEAARLRQKKSRSASDEKELEHLMEFEHELKVFRAELLRVAAFWKPDLNDGVQITAAPLWKLFQHKSWQKKLKETWEKLEAGEYDWAHLAYTIWPERVREKCKTDKSLAIAHGFEELYVDKANGKKKAKKKDVDQEELEL